MQIPINAADGKKSMEIFEFSFVSNFIQQKKSFEEANCHKSKQIKSINSNHKKNRRTRNKTCILAFDFEFMPNPAIESCSFHVGS